MPGRRRHAWTCCRCCAGRGWTRFVQKWIDHPGLTFSGDEELARVAPGVGSHDLSRQQVEDAVVSLNGIARLTQMAKSDPRFLH